VAYTTYLTWSAVSENDLGCTPTSNLVSENFATIAGAMFTFVASEPAARSPRRTAFLRCSA
jgi:hypothetical protein